MRRVRKARRVIAAACTAAVLVMTLSASPAFGAGGLTPPSTPVLSLTDYLQVKVAWIDNSSVEARFVVYYRPPTGDWSEWKVVYDHRTGQPQAAGWTLSASGSVVRTGDHCFAVAAMTDDGKVAIGLAQCVFVDERATARVPGVVGLRQAQANTRVRGAGLVPKFTAAGDWVFSQSPKSGNWVRPGATVSMSLRGDEVP